MTDKLAPLKVARAFPLYDPSLGEMGSLRKVVDAADYLDVVQLLLRYQVALRRCQRVEQDPAKASETRMLRDIARKLRARLVDAEKQLWVHSEGRASYFEAHPDARPPDSLRETRP